jgi:nitroreductase
MHVSGSAQLHPLLSSRWSPAQFDDRFEVAADEVESILEAARWTPSAGNSQPWAFIVGRRGDATHDRLVRHLAGSSRTWASSASMLVANLSHRLVEDTDWEYSEFSLYDLGQAVAHMTVQAQSLGLFTRQFRAFSREGLAADFAVAAHWEVTTMSAIGRSAVGLGDDPDSTFDLSGIRTRRSTEDLLWPQAGNAPR